MRKLLHTIEKILGIYRWHPKIALRYLPVVEEIKKLGSGAQILEIGSAGLGIAPYLRQQVIGLDIEFSPPFHPLLVPVSGTGTTIPFAPNSFDAVISIDMLEHIPKIDREKVIAQMLRIGRKLICIGVPCGEAAQTQDEQLKMDYKKRHGRDFLFLTEQIEYGVPEKSEIIKLIQEKAQQLGKHISIRTQGNINLKLRKRLMQGWISTNPLTDIFFRKILLLFIPIMKQMNHEPTYRQLFFVTIG